MISDKHLWLWFVNPTCNRNCLTMRRCVGGRSCALLWKPHPASLSCCHSNQLICWISWEAPIYMSTLNELDFSQHVTALGGFIGLTAMGGLQMQKIFWVILQALWGGVCLSVCVGGVGEHTSYSWTGKMLCCIVCASGLYCSSCYSCGQTNI